MEAMELENIERTYKGRKVLVTGHTGFKGTWLSIWLHRMGAEVVGFSLPDCPNSRNFELCDLSSKIRDLRGDLRDRESVQALVQEEKPEIVFNLAAQALVIDGYKDPLGTYDTNIGGTLNLLEAIRTTDSVKVAVFVTTDKVYENKEWFWPYRETEALGGFDPYSSSKGASELVISAYRNSFFETETPALKRENYTGISSARAGNVIGGGDWSMNRIVPDCINSLESQEAIKIRNPEAIRPWQHVLDPLYGYLLLGSRMYNEPGKYNSAWNFGPENGVFRVRELVDKLVSCFGSGEWIDVSDKESVHEAKLLALDINKAKYSLGWTPVLDFEESVQLTVEWYKHFRAKDPYSLCSEQIDRFQQKIIDSQ